MPLVEERRTDGAMEASGEEGEEGTGSVGRRRGTELDGDITGEEVDFRDAHVLGWVEAFGSVGVAESSYGIGVEIFVGVGDVGSLLHCMIIIRNF